MGGGPTISLDKLENAAQKGGSLIHYWQDLMYPLLQASIVRLNI